ncbi:MAG: hypothetical protein M3332_12315 [Actinomycetota bacterium]|nr:hypothetical protein [Actinomycetota bacterium]
MFDAALEGVGPYAKYAYFFVGQSYLAYDWTAGADRGGRAVDHGPRPMSEWDLPAPFNSGVTGALNGAGPYAGKAYFFRDAQYVEYDWGTGHGAGPYPMSAWPLPAAYLAGFDDAWSGEGSRAAYGYFLRELDYVRYRWSSNTLSAGYPKPFAERRVQGIVGGVDGCVNGRERYQGKAYFFLGDHYSRLSWDSLFGDSSLLAVARNWPGLAELAAVEPARRLAIGWIGIALARLAALGNTWPALDPVLGDALRTHFHITNSATAAQHLPTVRFRMQELRDRLLRLEEVLRFRTSEEAVADGSKPEYPGYTASDRSLINITQHYLTNDSFIVHGPRYKAAMIQHESGHQIGMMVDHAYEHEYAKYAALTVQQAVENTSSYLMFVQHMESLRDIRFDQNGNQIPFHILITQ